MCRLKIEITVDEPLLMPPQTHTILHPYTPEVQGTILTYSFAEVVAGKLRALLQSRDRLRKRGWGASRVHRDYYDLWRMLKSGRVTGEDLPALVRSKCEVRKVVFENPMDFFDPMVIATAQQNWNKMLMPFIQGAIPEAEKAIEEVRDVILAIWK